MFVSQITFSLGKTTPLQPITGYAEDQYANVKPDATCTVTFAPEECDPRTKAGQKLLAEAFALAQDAAAAELVQFHAALLKMLGR
ncbi:MAG: hypothetical protein ACREQ5_04425 [Candidatus Dormibacteria bacterium]